MRNAFSKAEYALIGEMFSASNWVGIDADDAIEFSHRYAHVRIEIHPGGVTVAIPTGRRHYAPGSPVATAAHVLARATFLSSGDRYKSSSIWDKNLLGELSVARKGCEL